MSNNLFMSTVQGSTANGNVINTTYNDLLNLIVNNNLVVGTIYQFNYLLKFNMIGTAGEFTADNIEVIQVFALSTSTISNKAYSVTYNESLIYDLNTTNIFNVSTVNSTGYISARYLESLNQFDNAYNNYYVGFDFRNQYFYKYATGTNLVGFTNIDNATSFVKYYSITNCLNSTICFCQNVEFFLPNMLSYTESDNLDFDYRVIQAKNSEINVIGNGVFGINSSNDRFKNVKLNNSVILSSIDNIIDQVDFLDTEIEILQNCTIQNSEIQSSNIFAMLQTTITDNSRILFFNVSANVENSNIKRSQITNFNSINVSLIAENSFVDNCQNNISIKSFNSNIIGVLSCEFLQNGDYVQINNCNIDFSGNNIVLVGNNNTYQYLIESNILKVVFAYSNLVNQVVNAFYIPNCFISRTLTYTITNNASLGANYQAGTDVLQSNTALNLNEGVILTQGYNQLNGTVINQPLTNITAGALKGKTITANSDNTIYQYFEFIIKNTF